MKWKRIRPKEKKISSEQEDKAELSKFANMRKKSAIRGLLNSGPASRNAETVGLKTGRSCKKEGKCSKEPEILHSKDFTSKKSRKISLTEKPQAVKKSEIVVKRRRRTKIEMALSYESRSPDLLEHIVEEVGYDCSANLERRIRGKSNNMSGCMKSGGSFWILDDNLIRSAQKKMEALENQTVQPSQQTTSSQQTTKPVPLVGLKCLSIQSVCLRKELDVGTMAKTIIQVSHAPPPPPKLTVNKEPSRALMQLESLTETPGFGQTDNVPALNNLNIGLEKLVQNKDTGVSGAVVEKIDRNLRPTNELNTERVHKEKQSITEECATNVCDALEDVAGAGASSSSIQVETQSNEVRSDELIKTAHTVRGIEDEVKLDYSGDVEVSDLEIESNENGLISDHSPPLNNHNAEGLPRFEERNGTLYKNKDMITCPKVIVERISHGHFPFGNDNHFDAIQMTRAPVIQTDICILNSVSLGRCHNAGTEIMNDKEKEIKTPSAQQDTDVRRMRRRKRKQLFTRRKKCKDASPNATKLKFPSADRCNSWSFQSSITDQVLSGCRLAESGRVGDMEISPEVESAASVLAMMSAGGRLFSGFQHGERHWGSGEPWPKYPPASNPAWTDFRQAGTYMCEVCGHVFVDLAMLRQHISEHERANQKSARRKQLRRKQTITKIKVTQTSPSAAPTHSATVKSCDSICDGTDKQLQNMQNLESKVQQSGDQPVTDVTQPAICMDGRPSQGDDISQVVEVDHGGEIANANVGSVTNDEAVVKLNEGLFDKKEIASKDVNLNQDDGILQTVEVELGGTTPPADARSVISKDVVQDIVNLNGKLSDETGIDSTSQTDVAGSQAVVGVQDMAGVSESEKEDIQVGNAKEILMNLKGDVCTSELIGQDRCEPNQSGITDIPHESTKELNDASQRSALVGSTSDMPSTEPLPSSIAARNKRLLELVEQVVGTMKLSGSVFALRSSNGTSVWAANVCCICNRKFSSAANARKHIRMQHNSYRPHKCKICGKAFPYPSSLLEHMTSHSTDPRKLICDMCGKVFIRQSGLRKHVKEQHETTRPHACNVCDKRFIYRCLLREHQRSHSDERTFKCTKCECVFKQTSNLMMHVKRRHENVCECPAGNCVCQPKAPRPMPPYSCVVCSKMFYVRKSLEIHLDTHDGRKPLSCQICEKEFPNKFVLSKHRMKHQETKTYSCEICNRNFLSKPAVKSHRQTHAGIKPYQCESCGKQYATKNSLKVRCGCLFEFVVVVFVFQPLEQSTF